MLRKLNEDDEENVYIALVCSQRQKSKDKHYFVRIASRSPLYFFVWLLLVYALAIPHFLEIFNISIISLNNNNIQTHFGSEMKGN